MRIVEQLKLKASAPRKFQVLMPDTVRHSATVGHVKATKAPEGQLPVQPPGRHEGGVLDAPGIGALAISGAGPLSPRVQLWRRLAVRRRSGDRRCRRRFDRSRIRRSRQAL